MFARVSDGSKIALAYLVAFLRSHGVQLIDCQQETSHLASLGASPISRTRFLEHVKAAIRESAITGWNPVDPLGVSTPLTPSPVPAKDSLE
jgi:leucyl/phenylalanyl-tRNA--protein transferase